MGFVLAALSAAPALAGAAQMPSGNYRLEVEVHDDDCGHDAFIDELPDSISVAAGSNGGLTLSGPPPWVEIDATIGSDGWVAGAGAGTVAGFSGVSVLLEGNLVEPGVVEGDLSFGPNGELPGGCPIIWKLTLISEIPVSVASAETTTTVLATTTTTTKADVAFTESPSVEVTTTTTTTIASLSAADDGGTTNSLLILIVGLMMFSGGIFWWWWLYRSPFGYGLAIIRWLNGLNKKGLGVGGSDPADADADTETPEPATTELGTDTSTSEPPPTDEETTKADDESGDGDDEQTRDGTDVFGSRTRPPPDCTPLVDECERLRALANEAALTAKRARERAEEAQSRCDDAKAAAQRAQEHLDDLEPRTNATNYYTRMAWAQQELRGAQDRERDACDGVEEARANAARAESDAKEAKARADEACARAQACLAGGG